MQIQETYQNDYLISTDKSKLDVAFIHHYLSVESYWAKNIPLDRVKKSIEGSLCFGLYLSGKQIGFARMITDGATFGYLCDVFIDSTHRGKGLSKWLMQTIMQHPDLQGLRRISLATKDAHGLYEQFGFKPLNDADRFMQIRLENAYNG
ncbi:GNAT family N-acetyltransferase [Pinibacter soli]|uniref:GNAT family N-acetyltransferase n=1 Tax=Pinibacter soli TaxID=3044211 RepID=A0ABT6RAU8_9BACT|nr:GNAT family N-acetyltransferase [Pinibacter soli]MDI3319004.1 GNAT family N-acetyltransferase [Pinibacter soli]